jgi:cytochrome b6-f complex iron-sulfur subunit
VDAETTAAPSAAAPTLTRRTVIAAGLAAAETAGVAAIAGCSSNTKAAPAASSDSSGGPPPLAKLSSIPVGASVRATLNGKPIMISQPTAGTVVAFTATCTHLGCTVAPAGKQFHCPCHGSIYDSATGTVISGPAPRPLAAIPVKIDSGNVVAG